MTLPSESPASVLTGILEPVGDQVWFERKGSQRMKRWEFKLSSTCCSPKAFGWGCFIGFFWIAGACAALLDRGPELRCQAHPFHTRNSGLKGLV